MEKQKVTPPGMAKEYGVSPKKITALILSGELKAMDIASPGSERPRYLIDRADIAEFEKSRRVIPDGGESTTAKLRRKSRSNVIEFF